MSAASLGDSTQPFGRRAGSGHRLMGMGLGWALLLASAFSAQAAKIGDLTQTRWTEQAWRFVTLSDPVVRYACLGTVLLGISCGLLGSFLVVRRMALLGGHFMWGQLCRLHVWLYVRIRVVKCVFVVSGCNMIDLLQRVQRARELTQPDFGQSVRNFIIRRVQSG